MSATRAVLWKEFFRTHCDERVVQIADDYPRVRSVDVDFMEVYDMDGEMAMDLFHSPDEQLTTAKEALRSVCDLSDHERPLHIRVRNNPSLTPVSEVSVQQAHRLLTVTGQIADVDAPQAALNRAEYQCIECGEMSVRTPDGIGWVRDPDNLACESCATVGSLQLLTRESGYVDVRPFQLAPLPQHEGEGPRSNAGLTVYIAGDLAGDVEAGMHCSVTGVLRVRGDGAAELFSVYMDGLSVTAGHDVTESTQATEVLEAHWDISVGD